MNENRILYRNTGCKIGAWQACSQETGVLRRLLRQQLGNRRERCSIWCDSKRAVACCCGLIGNVAHHHLASNDVLLDRTGPSGYHDYHFDLLSSCCRVVKLARKSSEFPQKLIEALNFFSVVDSVASRARCRSLPSKYIAETAAQLCPTYIMGDQGKLLSPPLTTCLTPY